MRAGTTISHARVQREARGGAEGASPHLQAAEPHHCRPEGWRAAGHVVPIQLTHFTPIGHCRLFSMSEEVLSWPCWPCCECFAPTSQPLVGLWASLPGKVQLGIAGLVQT